MKLVATVSCPVAGVACGAWTGACTCVLASQRTAAAIAVVLGGAVIVRLWMCVLVKVKHVGAVVLVVLWAWAPQVDGLPMFRCRFPLWH